MTHSKNLTYQAQQRTIEFLYQEGTLWATQMQIASLFSTDRSNANKHILNIYKEGELSEKATCAKIAQVQKEGNRPVNRKTKHYNLDVVISVGYRVQSAEATKFRIWATAQLRALLMAEFRGVTPSPIAPSVPSAYREPRLYHYEVPGLGVLGQHHLTYHLRAVWQGGQWLFPMCDVLSILGISSSHKARTHIRKGYVGKHDTQVLSKQGSVCHRNMWLLNKAAIGELLPHGCWQRSQQFGAWLESEVLPALAQPYCPTHKAAVAVAPVSVAPASALPCNKHIITDDQLVYIDGIVRHWYDLCAIIQNEGEVSNIVGRLAVLETAWNGVRADVIQG